MNSFGRLLTLTTWGESHGVSIGAVLDGVPAGIPLSEQDLQPFLDKRKPAQSRHTTQRREDDKVRILSGLYQGTTTGAPLMMMIDNQDVRSKDYDDIKNKYRPGHADFTYDVKYQGFYDPRGGGRASARETAMRVAAGAVARTIIPPISIKGALIQLGEDCIDKSAWDWEECARNAFFCPDKKAAVRWENKLDDIRKEGSSVGAIVEIHAFHVPVGLGEPVYDKLDARLAAAMMSIPAVKAVEIGAGLGSAEMRGEDYADRIRVHDTHISFEGNHNGGILGGISSGQDIVVRFAVKPTSSIRKPLETITKDRQNTTIQTKGRHDPCVGIRAVPIGEAMMALVLADFTLIHRASHHGSSR